LMPVIGWTVGTTVYKMVEKIDHWLAFLLLSFIGLRMIISALKAEDGKPRTNDPTKGGTLIMLSIATSLDALAVGLSISLLKISIWKPALIIGLIAFSFTAIGIQLGRIVGMNFKLDKYAEIIGGLVLIGIGVRILVEHGVLISWQLIHTLFSL
ncbi:MAG: manganese efflux pump MntP family protein, partial [candidate division KSB1 bacterium]|nr:manganese efflux pump MntP family protein [candidate division KSB1 bacterium]